MRLRIFFSVKFNLPFNLQIMRSLFLIIRKGFLKRNLATALSCSRKLVSKNQCLTKDHFSNKKNELLLLCLMRKKYLILSAKYLHLSTKNLTLSTSNTKTKYLLKKSSGKKEKTQVNSTVILTVKNFLILTYGNKRTTKYSKKLFVAPVSS